MARNTVLLLLIAKSGSFSSLTAYSILGSLSIHCYHMLFWFLFPFFPPVMLSFVSSFIIITNEASNAEYTAHGFLIFQNRRPEDSRPVQTYSTRRCGAPAIDPHGSSQSPEGL